jgi:hypothetical protein
MAIGLPIKLRAKFQRRALWQVRYNDGTAYSENERPWLKLPKHRRTTIILYCPDGKVVELGNQIDATGRLFQFSIAVRYAGLGGSSAAGETLSTVIGIVDDALSGQCTCFAWEGDKLIGPFKDNIKHFEYGRPVTDTLDWDLILGA